MWTSQVFSALKAKKWPLLYNREVDFEEPIEL